MLSKRRLLAAAAALVTVAAGCSSSKNHSTTSGTGSGNTGGGGSHSITIGILGDITGAAASGNKTSIQGVEAGINALAKPAGYSVKYVVGDDQTSPTAALSAAQKLVEQDHVLAVVTVSAVAFAAAPYLLKAGEPVIGVAEDSTEWTTDKNMFSVFGFEDPTKVSTTYGTFFKMEGVTTVGALGYSISPSSADAAKGAAISSQEAGLKVGYLNSNFPFGSTNVAPIALAMKNAGVDGFTATVDPNTGFALITALRQDGDTLKAALLPTGYGGDLSQAGPGAISSGQGVFFSTSWEPAEMHTAATEKFVSALRSIGVTTDPTYAEYGGYTSVALLMQGLQITGPNPSHAALISALSGITNFNAAGLFGTHVLDMTNRTASAIGVDGCLYITKLVGSAFQLVSGADPICGTEIQGKSAATS